MKLKKERRPRKPAGRWVYFLLYQDIIWPCPVRWEWEPGYGDWLPFYYAPTFEFIAADPSRVTRVKAPRRNQRVAVELRDLSAGYREQDEGEQA